MKTTIFSLALCALVFQGCSPQYYKPNRLNAPMLSHSGQVHLYAGSNNLQAAVSPVEHLGIMANVAAFSNSANYGSERVGFAEIGAGYYGRLDTTHRNGGLQWIYDIYGGVGGGRINIENNSGYRYPSMSITRMFVQPGIGFRTGIVEAAINWRVCNAFYGRFNLPLHPEAPLPGQGYLFTEPALTLRVGYRAIKGEMQFARAIPILGGAWNADLTSINVGICVLLGGSR